MRRTPVLRPPARHVLPWRRVPAVGSASSAHDARPSPAPARGCPPPTANEAATIRPHSTVVLCALLLVARRPSLPGSTTTVLASPPSALDAATTVPARPSSMTYSTTVRLYPLAAAQELRHRSTVAWRRSNATTEGMVASREARLGLPGSVWLGFGRFGRFGSARPAWRHTTAHPYTSRLNDP